MLLVIENLDVDLQLLGETRDHRIDRSVANTIEVLYAAMI